MPGQVYEETELVPLEPPVISESEKQKEEKQKSDLTAIKAVLQSEIDLSQPNIKSSVSKRGKAQLVKKIHEADNACKAIDEMKYRHSSACCSARDLHCHM